MSMYIPPAIALERLRQQQEEGYSLQDDCRYTEGELMRAATCYAAHWRYGVNRRGGDPRPEGVPAAWPWAPAWWKPRDALADLKRAGALILAEIDRRTMMGEETWSAVDFLKDIVHYGRLRGCW